MPNIHLYTTFYNEEKPLRRQELLTCLEKNLSNTALSSVTVFNERADLSKWENPKLKLVPIESRPTYQDFINYINEATDGDDIHIIANTDIYFEESINILKYINLHNTCLALSRWDTTDIKKPQLYNHNDSQDVWIFKGQIKSTLKADFPLGVPRCDNRFMYELRQAGYCVLNPAFSIKSLHIHKGQRAIVYTEDDNIYKIPPPYRYLYPHNMFGFWKTLVFNLAHQEKLSSYHYDIKKINLWWPVRLVRKSLELILQKKMRLIGYE